MLHVSDVKKPKKDEERNILWKIGYSSRPPTSSEEIAFITEGKSPVNNSKFQLLWKLVMCAVDTGHCALT